MQSLPKSLRLSPKQRFLCFLFCVSTFSHLALLVIVFYGTPYQQPLIVDTLATNPMHIVLMPLQKTITPVASTPIMQPKIVHNSRRPSIQNATPQSSKKNASAPIKTAPNQNQKSGLIIEKKEPIQKVTTPKPKPPATPLKKHNEQSKPIPPKTTQTEKQNSVAKKNSPMQSIPRAPAPAVATRKQAIKESDSAIKNQNNSESLYVGRDEFDQICLAQEIKIGVCAHWKRPAGIPSKTVCHLKVMIDMHGKKAITIDKSSGALAYDLSTKQALLQYSFPPKMWGREFILIM